MKKKILVVGAAFIGLSLFASTNIDNSTNPTKTSSNYQALPQMNQQCSSMKVYAYFKLTSNRINSTYIIRGFGNSFEEAMQNLEIRKADEINSLGGPSFASLTQVTTIIHAPIDASEVLMFSPQ